MKTSAKIGGLVAAVMLAVSGASFAAEQVNPYVHSTSGDIVKNSTGLCWRTGFWTPALAEALGVNGDGCACDADILDAAACKAVEEPAPVKAAEKVTFSADMLFNYNRSVLKDEGKAVLDDLVSRIAGVDIEVILRPATPTALVPTSSTNASLSSVLKPSRLTSSRRASMLS